MNKRVVTTVTDEQHDILLKAANQCNSDSSELMRYALDAYMVSLCEMVFADTRWPIVKIKHGGRRKGAGRPPKK